MGLVAIIITSIWDKVLIVNTNTEIIMKISPTMRMWSSIKVWTITLKSIKRLVLFPSETMFHKRKVGCIITHEWIWIKINMVIIITTVIMGICNRTIILIINSFKEFNPNKSVWYKIQISFNRHKTNLWMCKANIRN